MGHESRQAHLAPFSGSRATPVAASTPSSTHRAIGAHRPGATCRARHRPPINWHDCRGGMTSDRGRRPVIRCARIAFAVPPAPPRGRNILARRVDLSVQRPPVERPVEVRGMSIRNQTRPRAVTESSARPTTVSSVTKSTAEPAEQATGCRHHRNDHVSVCRRVCRARRRVAYDDRR